MAINPSQQLYLNVRAGFVAKGSSLSSWCNANGFHTTNARAALIGSWDGPKAVLLRERLITESGATPIEMITAKSA